VDERARKLRSGFERALWATRFVILVPVICSVLLAFAALYIASVEAFYVVGHLSGFTGGRADGSTSALALLAKVIQTFDIYLIAAALLIFALGLYELFISPLDGVVSPTHAGRLLVIRTLDDLKDRLAKLVLLVLVVEVLQKALELTYRTPLDMLYLSIAAVLVGGALFLSAYWAPRAHEDAEGASGVANESRERKAPVEDGDMRQRAH
jgi:uncharacterized membrane protein YqhA